jgi:predicted phage terminase large subunit-like protein
MSYDFSGKSDSALLPSLLEIDAEFAERHLADFIRQAWHVIEPGTEYLHNWHIDATCEYLQAVDAGQITRLLVNMPPRYMKSIMISVMWPVWSWINSPQSRWMFASYAGNLSTQHSVDRRTIIQSDWYQERWGDKYQLTSDQNVKTEYQNDKQGRMFATSFKGVATGKGGDRLCFDDAQDPSGVESDTQRETSTGTFRRKLSTRLNNKKIGAIVVVSQRLGSNDISGLCIEQGYVHLNLPAEDEPYKVISCPSGKTFTRDASGLLWPEREGPKEIAQAKLQLGDFGYAGQYMQAPFPPGGSRFKADWFRLYRKVEGGYKLIRGRGENQKEWFVADDDCQRFATMDPAGAEKEKNNKPCYTVVQVWAETPSHDMLLLHQYREQVQTPDAADAAVRICREWEVDYIGIEKDGIGLGVVQTVRRKGVSVRAIKARGSKEVRSQTAEIRMAAGMIHFPIDAPWLFDLQTELLAFPNGENLDQVDALAYAAMIVQRENGPPRDVSDDVHDAKEMAEIETEDDGEHPGDSIPRRDPNEPKPAPVLTTNALVNDWLSGTDED